MVSEDSDQVLSGLPMVHRLHQQQDLDEALVTSVMPGDDQLDAPHELFEVVSLGRSQRVPLKERDDDLRELDEIADVVTEQVLLVVVVPAIASHGADSEEVPQIVQHLDAAGALCHCEARRDLPTCSVAFTALAAALADQAE